LLASFAMQSVHPHWRNALSLAALLLVSSWHDVCMGLFSYRHFLDGLVVSAFIGRD